MEALPFVCLMEAETVAQAIIRYLSEECHYTLFYRVAL